MRKIILLSVVLAAATLTAAAAWRPSFVKKADAGIGFVEVPTRQPPVW